jgi:hypothetical protein
MKKQMMADVSIIMAKSCHETLSSRVNMLHSRSKFLRQSSIDPVHLAPTNVHINSLARTKYRK